MVILDLDGTLLRDDKTMSDYSKSVIRKCREKGIKVIFATVRGNVDGIVPPGLFDGCVLKSGALAYDGGVLIYRRAMRLDDVRGLLLACDKAGLQVVADNGEDGISYGNGKAVEAWPEDYTIADFAQVSFRSEKIYITAETAEAVRIVDSHLPQGVHLFVSRDRYAFLSHEEAVKSKAAAALAKRWGIKREEMACFGDDVVDIEIMRYCGVGVAMGNALSEVKEAADFVCDTNQHDGAAKWMEERVL